MPLLNYTTTIEAAKTVGEIQAILVKHGARDILLKYNDQGQAVALMFVIKKPAGDLPIRLPVDAEAVYKVMVKDYNSNSRRRIVPTKAQATRVAWRIMKDWVEAQMAILETEMVRLEQVFLPYMLMGDDKTVYQIFEARQFKMLMTGEKTE